MIYMLRYPHWLILNGISMVAQSRHQVLETGRDWATLWPTWIQSLEAVGILGGGNERYLLGMSGFFLDQLAKIQKHIHQKPEKSHHIFIKVHQISADPAYVGWFFSIEKLSEILRKHPQGGCQLLSPTLVGLSSTTADDQSDHLLEVGTNSCLGRDCIWCEIKLRSSAIQCHPVPLMWRI